MRLRDISAELHANKSKLFRNLWTKMIFSSIVNYVSIFAAFWDQLSLLLQFLEEMWLWHELVLFSRVKFYELTFFVIFRPNRLLISFWISSVLLEFVGVKLSNYLIMLKYNCKLLYMCLFVLCSS